MAAKTPESDSDFSDEDLSPLDAAFNKAAEHLRTITNKLDNNQLLQLYGFYKQAVEGKCNTPKPSWFDGRARKKWEAWKALEDLPQEEAKKKYVEFIEKFGYESKIIEDVGPKESWVAVSTLRHSPEPELVGNELSLLEAARENLGNRVTELLTKNPELQNEKDEDGLSALHWATDRDATCSLLAALKGGCQVDAKDNCGQTALHYAAACGHIKSTKILVTAGATLIKDEEGNTPLDLATDDNVINILNSVN